MSSFLFGNTRSVLDTRQIEQVIKENFFPHGQIKLGQKEGTKPNGFICTHTLFEINPVCFKMEIKGSKNEMKVRDIIKLIEADGWWEEKMRTGKEEVRKMLDQMPDDASFEDIQYHIYVLEKIERGLKDIQEGRLLSQEEIEQRMSKWVGK